MRTTIAAIILICATFMLTDVALAQTDFWEAAGADALNAQALYIGANDDIYAATFDQGFYRSTDNGDNWTQVNKGITNLFGRAIAVSSTGHVYAGTDFGGIFRSTDSGANWTEINNGLGNLGVNALEFSTTGAIFAGTQAGLYRSTDGGDSWDLVAEGSGSFVRTLSIDPGTGTIYAAGATVNSGLFSRSDDSGDTWTFIGGFGPARHWVQGLDVSGSGSVYAGLTFGGIFRSIDSGASWTEINIGVPPFAEIRSVVVDDNGDVYAAVQQRGVIISTNSGNLWSDVNSGLPVSPLIGRGQALALNSKGDLFLATSLGVFRHEVTSTTVDEGPDELPATPSLAQNYPNPFNPTTTISYAIPRADVVTLTVFDILGREVAVLVSGTNPAGQNEVTFDASTFPSGVYSYRLETGDFLETRRMIVLR